MKILTIAIFLFVTMISFGHAQMPAEPPMPVEPPASTAEMPGEPNHKAAAKPRTVVNPEKKTEATLLKKGKEPEDILMPVEPPAEKAIKIESGATRTQ